MTSAAPSTLPGGDGLCCTFNPPRQRRPLLHLRPSPALCGCWTWEPLERVKVHPPGRTFERVPRLSLHVEELKPKVTEAEVGDLGYASGLGNYVEYSGAPNEEEVLQYARIAIDCVTADPDGCKRALIIGGGIANFTNLLREKVRQMCNDQISSRNWSSSENSQI
ncbi:ATP-citrate synthase alpha chain protein 3 [Nymphaea thermarum]|nr:ATP-citrate synthase alpha chain protein 3 [Nymphaea thermarum]